MSEYKEPIRILHVTEMLSAAGIESFIMNMYRHMDRRKVQFDFLVLRNQKEFYDDEIEKLGGKKYYVQSSKKNTLLRIWDESRKIEMFLKKHSYKIIHIHYTTPLRAPYLKAALGAGVPVRIYHAHSAMVSGKSKLKLLIYKYYRGKIAQWATDYFACSQAAAEWIFLPQLIENDNVKIVFNGIDTQRFKYNEKKRNEIRTFLGIENQFVVVHTGRFIEQKNQKFVLEIFNQLSRIFPNSKLLLLGEGKLLDEMKEYAITLGIEQNVIFLGVKSNVEDYLCASDCYLMPSLYEGLPVAAVEAECTGLPCVLSENITHEVALQEDITFISLKAPIDEWCKQILKYKEHARKDGSVIVENSGYGIQVGANNLQKFYLNKVN